MIVRALILPLFLFTFFTSGLSAQTDQDKNDLISLAERGYGAQLVKMVRLLNEYPELRLLTDSEGNNLILIAAKNGNLSSFALLEEEFGFDPYSVNTKGQNGLAVHILGARIGVSMPFLDWMLRHYDTNKMVNTPDNDGVYPMMHAVEKKYLYLIKELHEKFGALLEIADNNGVTLAMRIAAIGDTTGIRYLREKGVKFSPRDINGNNAAWYAKVKGLRYPLAWEIEDFISSEDRLHKLNELELEKKRISMMVRKLVSNGDVKMLKDFVSGFSRSEGHPLKGMDWVNIRYDNGESLMHIATDAGRRDMVEYLYGVDPSLLSSKDEKNRTPIDKVDVSSDKETFEFLRDPLSKIKEKIMYLDISQNKKDLIVSLQDYCGTTPTYDLDLLSSAFIAKLIKDGVDYEADQVLFGVDEGLFETYGLYDYWMENLNYNENYQYVLLVGAYVFQKGNNRRITTVKITKGYMTVLGATHDEALKNSSKLRRTLDAYDGLFPQLSNRINSLMMDVYKKPFKIR